MQNSNTVPIGFPDRLFIGGEWVKPSSDEKIDVIAPTTEELYVSVAAAQEADIDRAVAAARAAFDTGPWPRLTHAERATYLRAMATAVLDRANDFAAVWPNEMGVLHGIAQAFMPLVSNAYTYYAGLAESFDWVEKHPHPESGGELALLVREPVGVVGAIIPWNAAVNIIAYKIAPALIAGCTVVVKSSPESPGAGLLMAEIAQAVGLPAGVLNVLTADRGPSEHLVRHPDVDKISFTGSRAAGGRIASLCGERIARVTLELGGKSAGIVLDDFDVETAADNIVGPACALSGQICSSLTRIVVTEKRHDALVDALAARFKAVRLGDPFDPATQLGPLASARARGRVETLVGQAIADGARVAAGGSRPAHLNRGFFFEPTILHDLTNSDMIAQEEIFGPVLCVIPARSEEDAIAIANNSIYGLNNSVFTNDVDRAWSVSRQLRSGTVGHNVWRSDFSVGFGGFKQSGIGREGGVDGLRPYLEGKTVILDGHPIGV